MRSTVDGKNYCSKSRFALKRAMLPRKANKKSKYTILFQKYFTYTYIIDIQQIDQDLIVSSWLIYNVSIT